MKNIVTANDSGAGVQKKRECETHLLRISAIDFNRINADSRDMNAAYGKFGKTLLKTPQLGVTKRSPVPAIKNQDRTVGREQIGQRNLLSILIGQRELRRFFADARRLS